MVSVVEADETASRDSSWGRGPAESASGRDGYSQLLPLLARLGLEAEMAADSAAGPGCSSLYAAG